MTFEKWSSILWLAVAGFSALTSVFLVPASPVSAQPSATSAYLAYRTDMRLEEGSWRVCTVSKQLVSGLRSSKGEFSRKDPPSSRRSPTTRWSFEPLFSRMSSPAKEEG